MIPCKLKKLFMTAAAAVFIACIFETQISAEYIFKNDGSIIKGSIVKDYPDSLSLKGDDGNIIQVKRNEIMRIIYTELYTGKVYVRLTTGEIIEGYLVYEDRDDYFMRKELTKPDEFKIPRKKVMFIAHTNPTDVKGNPSTQHIIVTWSPPFKPAKFYRVYLRDVMGREENFTAAGETNEAAYTLKNLKKSWTYEVYVTAVSDTGEESLPSEKVTVSTLPEPPENLMLGEELSPDGQKVTLTFKWKNVTDPESRVKSYTLYENEAGEKKKKGTSEGSEFVLKDFPAEGKHLFSVVSVNDIFAESDEVRTVYDAGYRIYARGMLTYIYPLGRMSDMATSGYGMLLDGGISWRRYNAGIETGILKFNGTKYIKSMMMIPFLLEADYLFYLSVPLPGSFSLRPALKAGWSYDSISYTVLKASNPLISGTGSKSSLDPMTSLGVYARYDMGERIDVFCGFEYSSIFMKSGRLSFVSCSLGAGTVF